MKNTQTVHCPVTLTVKRTFTRSVTGDMSEDHETERTLVVECDGRVAYRDLPLDGELSEVLADCLAARLTEDHG